MRWYGRPSSRYFGEPLERFHPLITLLQHVHQQSPFGRVKVRRATTPSTSRRAGSPFKLAVGAPSRRCRNNGFHRSQVRSAAAGDLERA
jgi:hypothetical protein